MADPVVEKPVEAPVSEGKLPEEKPAAAAEAAEGAPAAAAAAAEGAAEGAAAEGGDGAAAAKKKKKNKNRKKKRDPNCIGFGEDGRQQTNPPSVPMSKLFPKGEFREGEIQEYKADLTARVTSAEAKVADKLAEEDYKKIRKAAEVHRQVRKWAQLMMKVGTKYTDIADGIEGHLRTLLETQGLNGGIAFPCGINAGFIAAHDSAHVGDTRVLDGGEGSVVCFDFGVQVDGHIIDCAWTQNFGRPEWDKLIEAVKAATNTGIKEAGIDSILSEVGAAIQETMESYEVEIDGKTLPVKPIANLSGHSIEPYNIHAGKSVPIVGGGDQTRMEEGEHYAIETFGSTGRGHVVENYQCSHYMAPFEPNHTPIRLPRARSLFSHINKNYGTLAFSDRNLVRDGQEKYKMALKSLIDAGVIRDYPPLCDIKGSQTAQFEHTILLRPTCKEVVSRGEDY